MKNTLTVTQLIAVLQKLPQDLPVFAGWEGVRAPILEKNFSIVPTEEAGKHCVEIDVEEY